MGSTIWEMGKYPSVEAMLENSLGALLKKMFQGGGMDKMVLAGPSSPFPGLLNEMGQQGWLKTGSLRSGNWKYCVRFCSGRCSKPLNRI